MNFNFGEVLSRAWQIVWKRRVLWIFGILASCGRGGSNFNWNYNDSSSYNGGTPTLPPQVYPFLDFLAENMVSIIAITIGIICIIWIIMIFIGTVGRIGLIRGTWLAETDGNLAFGQLFSESLPYFWRVFGLALVVGLPFLLLIGSMVAGFVTLAIPMSRGNDASAIGFATLMPLFFCCLCLLVPIGFVVNLIVRQAERAIVLENAGILPALSRGWDIFRNNLGPIILMAIILAVVGLVVGFLIAIPILIVVIPATFAFLAGNAVGNGPNWTPLIMALACMCILTPFLWLVSGIMVAYIESAWTLTYMRIVRPVDTPPVIIEANA